MNHLKIYEEYNSDSLNEDIAEVFPYLSEEMIEIISTWDESDKDADNIMQKLNFIMEGYGVEAILGAESWSDYWLDTVALYVNMGDSNENTIIYDTNKGKFRVNTFQDWVSKHREKYDIK